MATLVRWEPIREIATLQNEMSRLMNTFTGFGNGNGVAPRTWVPAVDVWETENELVYAFDLPGIPEEKISLELEDSVLTVSAERERSHELSDDRLYRFGSFSRSISLPQGVGEEQAKAEYHDGVLEVRVAKPEQSKPRRIQIGGGDQKTIEGTATKGYGPLASLPEGGFGRLRPLRVRAFEPGLVEQVAQAGEAGEHPALDRPERLVEPLGELALGKPAVVAELERLALLGR